jgi:hypothetical protein
VSVEVHGPPIHTRELRHSQLCQVSLEVGPRPYGSCIGLLWEASQPSKPTGIDAPAPRRLSISQWVCDWPMPRTCDKGES